MLFVQPTYCINFEAQSVLSKRLGSLSSTPLSRLSFCLGLQPSSLNLGPVIFMSLGGPARRGWSWWASEDGQSRRHLPNGQIASAIGDKCISTAGDAVVLGACDSGASSWEAQGNGVFYLIRLRAHMVGRCFSFCAPRSIAVWPELLEPRRPRGGRRGCRSAR